MTPHTENILTWCISMYHVIALKQTRGIKNVTPKAAKKSSSNGQRATGNEERVRKIAKIGNLLACESQLGS